jgi:hypothetical protein
MNEASPAHRYEPRWPIVLTILVVLALLALLPGRVRLFPPWLPYILVIAELIPVIAIELTKGDSRWLRIERPITTTFVILIVLANLTNLANLFQKMVLHSTEMNGLQLFASSIAVWVTNVLAFALIYWQVDRGGAEVRISHTGQRPDWLFPHEGMPAEVVKPGWLPTFIDYLYLGFSTATAFSATDVLPLTARAKLLMMLDSTISLLTLVVVAARAINILG